MLLSFGNLSDRGTFKLYTNGKKLLTLANRKFVHTRSLWVALGGQDDDKYAVLCLPDPRRHQQPQAAVRGEGPMRYFGFVAVLVAWAILARTVAAQAGTPPAGQALFTLRLRPAGR